ncbi:MAG: hypothetical protein IJV40_04070 [Oscillospiraceae bacterium]|nr:hypothetical protein [Oscillospiraceae bacterium]
MRTDEYFMGWQYSPVENQREAAIQALFSMVKYWKRQVRIAEDELREYRSIKYSARISRPGGVPGGGRGDFDDRLVRGVATEDRLRQRVDKARQHYRKALAMMEESLGGITTPKAKEAIRLVHLEGKTAPEAGAILEVSDRHIRRLKAKGYREMRLPVEWEKRVAA